MNEAAAMSVRNRANAYRFKPGTVREMIDIPDEQDELTGLMNARTFRKALQKRWNDPRFRMKSTCVISMDLDYFRDYNYFYGRAAGDHLLCAAARSLNCLVTAAAGQMARYGGEEFIAFVPGMNRHEGEDFANGLLRACISLEFEKPGPERGFVTASFGVAASAPFKRAAANELIEAADRALHLAKKNGRNRIESVAVRQPAASSTTNIREFLAHAG